MLNKFARALFGRIFGPIADLLLRLGVSPDAVTVVGTIGVMVGALGFFPRGELFWGVMVVTAFVFSDIVDGLMARKLNRSSKWGAFLDSSLDRFGDAAVFGGYALYYVQADDRLGVWVSIGGLALGGIVSYIRAKAEGLGWRADVGILERSDRLVSTLVVAGFVGLGVPDVVLTVTIAIVCLGSLVTIVQRVRMIREQAFAQPTGPAV